MKPTRVLSIVLTCAMIMTSILTITSSPILAAPVEDGAFTFDGSSLYLQELSSDKLINLSSEQLHEYITSRIPDGKSDEIYPEAAYRLVGETLDYFSSTIDTDLPIKDVSNTPTKADMLWREQELARIPYDEITESPRPNTSEMDDYLSGRKEVIMQLDPETTFEPAQNTKGAVSSIDDQSTADVDYVITDNNTVDTAGSIGEQNMPELNSEMPSNPDNASIMAAATPYISVYNITKTSITVSATFPVYSAWFNNINLYDHSNGSWSKIAGDCSSGTYTKTGLKPFTKYTVELQWWDNGAQSKQVNIYTLGDTPSFTSTVTETSITVNATFPGTYNNRITYYVAGWNTVSPDGAVKNGSYTFSNLTPGMTYTVEFWYWDWPNERWSVTTKYITTKYIAETWQTTETAHMKFSFEPTDINRITASNYTTWKNRMEYAYVDMAEFTGATPYSGQKIEIKSTRTLIPNYAAVAGNPILINQAGVPDMFKRININGDWSFGAMHELGHDFSDYRYDFDGEFFANFMQQYVVEKRGAKVYVGGSYYSGGTALENYYYNGNSGFSYQQAVAQGKYTADRMMWTMIQIKRKIGWTPFTKTFAYIRSLSSSQLPSTNIAKFNLFMSKLKDFSGVDVFSYLTTQDKSVYQQYLGGTIQYTSQYTIVVIPGTLGSRLYKTVNGAEGFGDQVWEPDFGSLLQGWANNKYPFMLCTEDGIPTATLSTFGNTTNAYGAQDIYKKLVEFLRTTYPQHTVKFFSYDWRLGNDLNAQKLQSFLANDTNVIIVAHSMGGLVTSSYLATSQANRDKVKKLITIGTPYEGATKAIGVFETGDLIGWPVDIFLGGYIKDLSKNTPSVYELLPTSRYPVSYVGLLNRETGTITDYSHTQAKSYLSGLTWARYNNGSGSTKSIFNKAYDVHNKWMLNGTHVANLVDVTYIIGASLPTPYQAVYTTVPYPQYEYFRYAGGDETVIEHSARNGAASYFPFNYEHTNLVKEQQVLNKVRDIINSKIQGNGYQNGSVSQENDSLSIPPTTSNIHGKVFSDNQSVCVVLDGTRDITITTSEGIAIHENEGRLSITDNKGNDNKIGVVWSLNEHHTRKQYVLPTGQYVFSMTQKGNSTEHSEVIIMSFDGQNFLTMQRYTDITNNGDMLLRVSTGRSEPLLKDKSTNEIISPSYSADAKTIDEMNRQNELN